MLELLPLIAIQSSPGGFSHSEVARRISKYQPFCTVQFWRFTFAEFQVSVPSVLTVPFPLLLVEFMNIFDIVTLAECEIKECQNWAWDHVNPSTNRFVEL